MKFPNKVNRYKTTIISKMTLLLDTMEDSSNDVSKLYKKISKLVTIQEFVDAAACLYALGIVEKDIDGGLVKCSRK